MPSVSLMIAKSNIPQEENEDPSSTNSSETLQKEYSRRFSEIEDYRVAVWKILVKDYFQDLIGAGKSVLDLGSGWGEFINQIESPHKFAMDLNPEGKHRVSEEVTFLEQDCSKKWDLEDESIDTIFTSNFFEHLPSKQHLVDTLNQGLRCLKRGGKIICLGPNIRYVGPAYWDFFDHYLPLSHHSLTEALELCGYSVEKVIPRFLPYTMAQGKNPPLLAVRLFLKMSFAWPMIGKQFLIVASKR